MNKEFWDYNDNKRQHKEKYGLEIIKGHHIHERRRYKNIFEARFVKTKYLIKEMPTLVNHYHFMRYEDLKDNYENKIKEISSLFSLELNDIIRIDTYKGKGKTRQISKNKNIISREKILGNEHFLYGLERELGYYG